MAEPLALSPARRAWLMVGIMAATLMQVLDTTIANVSLPRMEPDLGATQDTINWVLTSYIVASAIAMPLTGWIADRIGARRLLIGCVIAFTAASMLCGVATNLAEMVAFRAIQGVTGAFISPLAQATMVSINPPDKQARAMSIWGMAIMIGPITGPLIGGWLTENFDWRWCFFVNLPVGIGAVALLWALLPDTRSQGRALDTLGFFLLAAGLVGLQLLLDRGQEQDWFDSREIWLEGAVMVAGFWMFGVHLAFARQPLFRRDILFDRNFAPAMVFMGVVGVVMMAVMALLPPMLQTLFNYSVLETGWVLMPRGVGILVTMFVAGRVAGKLDARVLVALGLTVASFSLWEMTRWSLEVDQAHFLLTGFVQGLGLGFLFIPLNLLAFAGLPPSARTEGASLLNLTRSIGSSIGISIVSTETARSVQTNHQELGEALRVARVPYLGQELVGQLGSAGDTVYSALNAEVNRQALMIAYLNDFHLMMWVPLAALPLLLLLRRAAAPAARPDPAAAAAH